MKPSWGKTIGVFFLCWVLAFLGCVFTSIIAGHYQGFSGYSRGGLSVLVVGIICAAIYRSSGKAAGVVIGSIVTGIIVGLLAVLIATQMVAGHSVDTSHQSNSPGKTVANSSAESGSPKPSEDYAKTSIEDPASLTNSPLAKRAVKSGRSAEKWNERNNPVDIGFKRITFGGLLAGPAVAPKDREGWGSYNGSDGRQTWGSPNLGDDATFTDLHETLYVALAEMLDNPEQAREVISNPNVLTTTKEVNHRVIDYVEMFDTFKVDGKQYKYRIHFIVDNNTHSQEQSPSLHEIEICNYDVHQYGEPIGRMQDLDWPVFYS